jgi:hypothetical protein
MCIELPDIQTYVEWTRALRVGHRLMELYVSEESVMGQQSQLVFTANGDIHAAQVRAFLEAAGIATTIRAESLRQTHGLTLDGLGAVEIFVAGPDFERARRLLDAAETGKFRLADTAEEA